MSTSHDMKLFEFDLEHAWRIKALAQGKFKIFFKNPKYVPVMQAVAGGNKRAKAKFKVIVQNHMDKTNASVGYKSPTEDSLQIIDYMITALQDNFEDVKKYAAIDNTPSWLKERRAQIAKEQAVSNEIVNKLATKYKITPKIVLQKVTQMAANAGKPLQAVLHKVAQKVFGDDAIRASR